MNRPSAIGAALLLGMALAAPAFSEDSPQQLEAERIVAAIEQGGPTVESLLLFALDGPEPEIGIGAVQQYAFKHYGLHVRPCGWVVPELAIPTVHVRLEEMAFDLPSDSKTAYESAVALSLIRETREDEGRYLEQLKAAPDSMLRSAWIGVILNDGLCKESIIQEIVAGLIQKEPEPWVVDLAAKISSSRLESRELLLEPLFELVQSDEYFLAICSGDNGHTVPEEFEQTERAVNQILQLGDNPIPFGVFAAQPSSEVTCSMETARLVRGESEVVLSAIVVHNSSCEGSTSTRKGLRIELRDHSAAHTLFLEDSAVDLVSEQLRNMEADLDHYPEVRDLPPGGCHGTYEFLKRKPPLHQVSMDYCNNLDAGEGMLISVFIQEVHSYHFPGLGPGELASALDESLATIVMLCSL